VTTFDTGRRAEAVAAQFLERKGCIVVDQNWRTRWCEIDLVAQRADTVYFCEVKYRAHGRQGSGIDYITEKKLGQMHFAATFWLAAHEWLGLSQLCAIEVSGKQFRVTRAIKIAL
jgi:uncharacterized protein (TIGR00252 family)